MYWYVHYHDENFGPTQIINSIVFQTLASLLKTKLKINILRKYKCFQNIFITIKYNSAEEKDVIKPVSIYLQHL
jgi:hypothetical protein